MERRSRTLRIDAGLPAGVQVRTLEVHRDSRGALTEIFRNEWGAGIEPVQWNCVTSSAGTLRGVHVHKRHGDYFTVVSGRASVGLRDLRSHAPTNGCKAVVRFDGEHQRAITIPHGVAHGFYFHEASVHLYSVSR